MTKIISKKRFGAISTLIFASISGASYAGDYALTISPLHLTLPVVELTLENGVSEGISVAGTLGYGSVTVADPNNGDTTVNIFEAGAQLRYYTGGDTNRGFHVGAEGQYIKPFLDDVPAGVTVQANGIAVGPFIGYKWNTSSNFVYDLQAGYQFFFAQAKAKNSQGDEIESSTSDGAPLLNINVGFSF